MEVIRKIIDDSSHEIVIELPESYQHKKLEVIVLPIEDDATQSKQVQKKYDYSKFFGTLNWQGDAVAEQRKLRDEWD